MSWSNRFIGIPFVDLGRDREGADCWGLARIIYHQELGIALPDYIGAASALEHAEIAAMVAGATASPLWDWVDGPAQPFDLAVFRRGRLSTHIGIVVTTGLMIHMATGDQARVEDYRAGRWKSRFQGHFRWAAMALEPPVQDLSEQLG